MLFKPTETIPFAVLLLLLAAVPAMADVPAGRIVVSSVPTGALACIDNTTCDTTGATFTVAGNAWHSVVVTEKGYRQWTENVYVTSGQTSTVDAYLDLDPAATAIRVTLTQGSGTVCLDNTDCRANVGASGNNRSTLFTGVSPGYHTVLVEASADFSDATQLVQVTLGKVADVSIDLAPSFVPPTPTYSAEKTTGTVRVYVDRTGSTICLDNTDCYVNVGGSNGSAGTGTVVFNEVSTDKAHIVTVAADGYKPVSTPITVSKDMITTVDVKLQRASAGTTEPTAAPTSPATIPPTMPTARSPSGFLTVIGAISLCTIVFIFWHNRK